MLAPFPVICGVGLSKQERLLVEYWLDPKLSVEVHESLPVPSRLSDGKLHLVWQVGLSGAASLSEWGVPTLLVVGSQSGGAEEPRKALYEKVYKSGASAVWELPKPGQAVVFPEYHLPDFRGQVFATSGDEVLLRHYRQVAAFAGLDLRTDFRNAEDLLGILAELFAKNKKEKNVFADPFAKEGISQKRYGALPRLLIIDLDAPKIDALPLFSGLESLFRQGVHRKEELPVLVTKDFERPGLDLRQIDSLVRPWTRRIFHPTESLKLLFEVLFLSDASSASSIKRKERPSLWRKTPPASRHFHTLKELLYSEKAELCMEEPVFWPTGEAASLRARRIEPFRWFYRYHKQSRFRGIVLSDTPKQTGVG